MELSLSLAPLGLAPLGCYFLLLAWRHASRRAVIVSGLYDRWLLVVASLGMLMVGPLKMVWPLQLFARWEEVFGETMIWAILTFFVAMLAAAAVRRMRPSIVIYNMAIGEMEDVIESACQRIDPTARRLGRCVLLPQRGVEFSIDVMLYSRCAVLVATSRLQSETSWQELGEAVRTLAPPHHRRWDVAAPMAALGGTLLVIALLAFLLPTLH